MYRSLKKEGWTMAVIGRPREFDRNTALEVAMRLFWQKGFLTTSMTDLCDAMGIRSPSLYAAFGSKEALYLEAIDQYVRTIGPPIWNKLAEGTTARASVESLLLAATDRLPESEKVPAGCMAMLAAACEEWPVSITEVVKKVRSECLGMLRSRLNAAVADGELASSTDTDRLSRFYLSVFQGMAIQARDGATTAVLKGVAETAMAAWPIPQARD
jgi:AcrR family transcriptional regulator